MNERIWELASKSGFDVSADGKFGNYSQMYKVEKFAELIIKECADYVRSNYDSWDAEPLAFNMEKDFGLHGDYA